MFEGEASDHKSCCSEPSAASQPAAVGSGDARRNIEIKARLKSLDAARQVAERIATSRVGIQRQTDTYFTCRRGRLKLREIEGAAAQLIAYVRPDVVAAKASDYRIAAVENPSALKQTLQAACGIATVVEKRREIFLWKTVRIHLDQVVGKGDFLEFEAVLDQQQDEREGQKMVEHLMQQFAIRSSDLLPSSYADMP